MKVCLAEPTAPRFQERRSPYPHVFLLFSATPSTGR